MALAATLAPHGHGFVWRRFVLENLALGFGAGIVVVFGTLLTVGGRHILVLSEGIARGSTIFNLAALTVFASIIAHGVSDTAGSEWIARRSDAGRDPDGERELSVV